ncbi:MAG TPA: sulfotransferase, partial [Bacteroidia bacterium]|nr:sulfotransferase [Bacteroidia bacterium]HNT79455.1 sulfotransferase [Bacteroidia bacterium]
MQNVKVNFFIVGAAKSGTTSLYHYLNSHPEIFMSELKETNYFSSKEILEQKLFYNEVVINEQQQYEKLFEKVKNERAIGEASVSYLYYDKVPQRIFEYNPKAKIIILLRNPVERAISHHAMDQRMGWNNIPLSNIFDLSSKHQQIENYFQQYILLGNYFAQVKRYFDCFGKENVKVILFEDIKKDIQTEVSHLYTYLNVDSSFVPQPIEEDNAAKEVRSSVLKVLYQQKGIRKFIKASLPGNLRKSIEKVVFSKKSKPKDNLLLQKLSVYYKDDINQLAQLLNLNLQHWHLNDEHK